MSDPLLARAERALHQRRVAALVAAVDAGLPGRFAAYEHDGLLVSVATDPALPFLRSVQGVTPATVDALAEVLLQLGDAASDATVIVAEAHLAVLSGPLRALGLRDVGRRPTAVANLPLLASRARWGTVELGSGVPDLAVTPVPATERERTSFVDLLVAGYAVEAAGRGAAGAFLRCEHDRLPLVRTVATISGREVGAAAWSRHGEVAVLGGASTVAAARGRGVQLALLTERLARAARDGAELAVATALDGSTSLRNLTRAGLVVMPRRGWQLDLRRQCEARRG